jgi:excisionase family DNA binding protein
MVEFVTLTEAAKMLGVSRWTLYRRITEGALTVYQPPSHRREKFVKRVDVERLATPAVVPVAQSRKGEQR